MSEHPHIKMEEAEDAEEDELLGGGEEDDGEGDGGDVDETALMTDMKLEDEIDEIRAAEPNFSWQYHIEIYPWSADDMTESFVRLIKLAHFSKCYMRKKSAGKEAADASSEKVEDKLHERQRKGCLHLYTDSWLNARSIMRSATWKSMSSKELTFEITKRNSITGTIESACLELDTYSASKTRFRDKSKGELKDRSAKVSNLPGTISWEFLGVVFCRAYAVIGGTTVKEFLKDKEANPQQKLQEVKDFDGSLDFDCLARGSCRAFVLAHKSVYIEGQKVTVVANDKETMVVPPFTHESAIKNKESEHVGKPTRTNSQSFRGRGVKRVSNLGAAGIASGILSAGNDRGFLKDSNLGRGRDLGRAMMPPQRPVSAPFVRAGPGMPIPMTGRQKMNEKLRRNNFGLTTGSGGMYPLPGGSAGARPAAIGSVGDSFKQEIASLQSQLERSTQELEARIAMLQQTTHSRAGSFYEEDAVGFQSGRWGDSDFDYNEGYKGYIDEDYFDDGGYAAQDVPNYGFETAPPLRRPVPAAMTPSNMGFPFGSRMNHGPQRGSPGQGMKRGEMLGLRKSGGSVRGMSGYW